MQYTPDDIETETEDYDKDDTKERISSSPTGGQLSSFTVKEEKRLLRRIDIIVLPLLCAVAFLQVNPGLRSGAPTSLYHAAYRAAPPIKS